ncbi:MAG: SDR family NAD(P)-dependent oxidoreductase [Muribaculaceae bacterium]|jgi:short-subunit dehydrogenase|nr:SDR family NAD(P)-dependent oxidoreductase [Muribaculaceae bacterium]
MKKIIIVGASSGIGERIATDFARAGWRVGVAARRVERLNAIKELYPANVAVAEIDVTRQDAVKNFNGLIELTDGMDILLYAAGTGFYDPDLEDTRIDTTLSTNVTGFARIVAAAYRYFKATANRTPGQIAVITSVAGTKGIGVAAAYSASKQFQQRFINALEQLAYQQQVNVRFTDIRPGFVRTPLLDPEKEYPMIMSIDQVAPLIETAILKRKRRATIDSRWAIVNGIWRLVPQCVWRHISLKW